MCHAFIANKMDLLHFDKQEIEDHLFQYDTFHLANIDFIDIEYLNMIAELNRLDQSQNYTYIFTVAFTLLGFYYCIINFLKARHFI